MGELIVTSGIPIRNCAVRGVKEYPPPPVGLRRGFLPIERRPRGGVLTADDVASQQAARRVLAEFGKQKTAADRCRPAAVTGTLSIVYLTESLSGRTSRSARAGPVDPMDLAYSGLFAGAARTGFWTGIAGAAPVSFCPKRSLLGSFAFAVEETRSEE